MEAYDYIEEVIIFLSGRTKLNFQMNVGKVLKEYYRYIGKKFIMPSPDGGDDKNDGWVEEDALFYQFYAPITQYSGSFVKNMQNKFSEDLNGLLIKLSVGKWNSKLNKFIYIVNTFDGELPKDSEGYFSNEVMVCKAKFNQDFVYEVSNLDYVRELLYQVKDIEILKRIATQLRISNLIPYEPITEKIMYDFISKISDVIYQKFTSNDKLTNYERISSSKKISINDLENSRDDIENIIDHLDIVNGAISIMNQDIISSGKFERVKSLVIDQYKKLSKEFNGEELLEKMYDSVQKFSPDKNYTNIPSKYLIVYIFDHCDIFKKEEDLIGITK